MKKLLFAFVMLAGAAFAQTPDCFLQFTNQTVAGSTNYQDNRRNACTNWVLTYQTAGFTAISLQFESATGASSPGAFGAFSGAVVSGVNPSTSVACATVTNCTAVFSGQVGWYRLNLSSVTGSGTVSATLKGYIGFIPLGGNSISGGCPGTAATPCVVAGPAASGAAVAGNPVLMGASDGVNIRNVIADSNGRLQVGGSVASGSPPAANPIQVAGSDGTNVRVIGTSAPVGIGNATVAALGMSVAGVDATANTNVITPQSVNLAQYGFLAIAQHLFNGTTWDRVRSASLANYPTAVTTTSVNKIGVQLGEKGARWSVVSAPAATSKATASIAAEVNVRHVVDCVSFSATASAAILTNSLTIAVRDGATGAGTVIWEWVVNPVNSGTGAQSVQPHSVCGLMLTGTTNTAMTVEFSSGITNVSEAISFSGFNVN